MRVHLFARERDGDEGFEFSEPRTGPEISDLSGAPKRRFLTHVEVKKRWFWSTYVQLVFGGPSCRRVRVFAGARGGCEGFDFLAS